MALQPVSGNFHAAEDSDSDVHICQVRPTSPSVTVTVSGDKRSRNAKRKHPASNSTAAAIAVNDSATNPDQSLYTVLQRKLAATVKRIRKEEEKKEEEKRNQAVVAAAAAANLRAAVFDVAASDSESDSESAVAVAAVAVAAAVAAAPSIHSDKEINTLKRSLARSVKPYMVWKKFRSRTSRSIGFGKLRATVCLDRVPQSLFAAFIGQPGNVSLQGGNIRKRGKKFVVQVPVGNLFMNGRPPKASLRYGGMITCDQEKDASLSYDPAEQCIRVTLMLHCHL
jgi:hypothetical protein